MFAPRLTVSGVADPYMFVAVIVTGVGATTTPAANVNVTPASLVVYASPPVTPHVIPVVPLVCPIVMLWPASTAGGSIFETKAVSMPSCGISEPMSPPSGPYIFMGPPVNEPLMYRIPDESPPTRPK
jgi:hypothetical protein